MVFKLKFYLYVHLTIQSNPITVKIIPFWVWWKLYDFLGFEINTSLSSIFKNPNCSFLF